MAEVEKKAASTMNVNGQTEVCEIEHMTVRHPETGARFDVRMDPAPKVPIVITGYTDDEIETALYTELQAACDVIPAYEAIDEAERMRFVNAVFDRLKQHQGEAKTHG